MSVKRIEALLDAVARLNGAFNPESKFYQIRNPLAVRSFARPGKHVTDSEGHRVFESFLSGYKASLFDLQLKLSGRSRAGLTVESTLENLLGVYGVSSKAAMDNVISFVRRALQDQSVSTKTPVSYFLEELDEKPAMHEMSYRT